jgi:ABC-2 type transport system permease protein
MRRPSDFWLSLLAFPLFAVLGGAIPVMMKSSEPVREVVVVEEGPQAAGLAAAVQTALREDQSRREKRRKEAEAKIQAHDRRCGRWKRRQGGPSAAWTDRE